MTCSSVAWTREILFRYDQEGPGSSNNAQDRDGAFLDLGESNKSPPVASEACNSRVSVSVGSAGGVAGGATGMPFGELLRVGNCGPTNWARSGHLRRRRAYTSRCGTDVRPVVDREGR